MAPPEGRAYEQVTPLQKGGGIPDIQFMNALPDGSGVRYLVRGAPTGAEGSPFAPRFLSLRGDEGWSPWVGADPPFSNPDRPIFQTTLAIADDGSHAFVVSNRSLAPGAVDAPQAANLYVKDLRTGLYTWVATSTASEALMSFAAGGSADDYVDGAPDLSWVLFFSGYPLLPEVGAPALYRWSASAGLEVVSVLPGGAVPSVPVQRDGWNGSAFLQASADGRRVFFGLEGGPIYRREGGVTTPVSISSLDGSVQAADLIGTDATGRFVYCISSQPLLADVAPRLGGVYRYDLETGDLLFVGTVPGSSYIFGIGNDGHSIYFQTGQKGELIRWHDGIERVVTQGVDPWPQFLSPDGNYLAFEQSGDIYLYDAAEEQLSCASCLDGQPTGAAKLPLGRREFDYAKGNVVDDRGGIFFTSSAALRPEDVNGVKDVYVFRDGSASLVSPGTQPARAWLGDVSNDGSDVFFVTAASLVGQDRDGEADVYDARVGGGFPPQGGGDRGGCGGEGCQQAAVPSPPAPAIGSETAAVRNKASNGRRKCSKVRARCARKGKKRSVRPGRAQKGRGR